MKEKTILEFLDEIGHKYWKKGDLYQCHCLFHDDIRTPNMYIWPETNSFYCFRCSTGFSVIDFVRKHFEVSKQEAEERVYGQSFLRQSILKSDKKQTEDVFQMNIALAQIFRSFVEKQADESKIKEFLLKLKPVYNKSIGLKDFEKTLKLWTKARESFNV